MARSKPAALPLGDIPIKELAGIIGFEPMNGEIKTRCLTAWRYPSRNCFKCVSTLHFKSVVRKERLELSHLAILEPKSSASTNSATSAKFCYLSLVVGVEVVATPWFEQGTPSLWVMCSNQLSYVATCLFRLPPQAMARIMLMTPQLVNSFF